MNIDWCKNCDRGLPKPDLVIFLKISEKETAKRAEYGDEIYERIEFQCKVKEQYNRLLESDWQIVDANDTIENVHMKILQVISETT